MLRKDDRATTDRRGFLKFASVGSMAGAAALLLGRGKAEAAAPEAGSRLGYRESEHVRRFYESARF